MQKFSLNQAFRRNCVKALLLLFIVSGATLGVSSKEAHAFTIYSQPDDSVLYFSPIGDSNRSFGSSTTFYVPTDIGTTTLTMRFSLGYKQNPFGGSCAGNVNNTSVTLNKASGVPVGTFNFDSPFGEDICAAGNAGTAEHFDVSLSVVGMVAGDYYFYQNPMSTANFEYYYFENADGEMYFELADGSFSPPSSSITLTSPTEQTYIGNPITFEGEYTNADTFDEIQFDLVSTSYGINVNFPSLDIPLSNVVNEPWSTVRNLPFNGNYDVRVRLHDSFTGSTTPYTSYVSFAVGTTTPASTIIDDVLGATVGSATSSLVASDNLFSFLNIPQLLQTKEPFAYFPAISSALRTAFSDSIAPSVSIVSVPFKVNGATSTLTLFSSSTVTTLMTPTYLGLLRGLEAAVIWFLAAMLMYHRARSKHIL